MGKVSVIREHLLCNITIGYKVSSFILWPMINLIKHTKLVAVRHYRLFRWVDKLNCRPFSVSAEWLETDVGITLEECKYRRRLQNLVEATPAPALKSNLMSTKFSWITGPTSGRPSSWAVNGNTDVFGSNPAYDFNRQTISISKCNETFFKAHLCINREMIVALKSMNIFKTSDLFRKLVWQLGTARRRRPPSECPGIFQQEPESPPVKKYVEL